jgi:hypothetical protein
MIWHMILERPQIECPIDDKSVDFVEGERENLD